MKKKLVLAILFFILTAELVLTAALDNPSMAEEYYLSGQYEAAAAIYESLAEQDPSNYAIHLNLGHTYYQAGFLGKALLSYRRAQELRPRLEAISQNIARIRAERVTFQGEERIFVDYLASLSVEVLTLRELAYLSFALWTSPFLVGAFVIGSSRLRRIQRISVVIIVLGVFAILSNGMLFARLYTMTRRPAAVVVSVNAEIYSGPGYDYLVIGHLYSATELRVVAREGIWCKFVLPNGNKGWIVARSISEV